MIPVVDSEPDVLSEAAVRGLYWPQGMAVYVRGLKEFGFTDHDHLLNSTLLHEYVHHLQFCATPAGLCYFASLESMTGLFVTLVRAIKRDSGGRRLPRRMDIGKYLENGTMECTTGPLVFERQWQAHWLGWPLKASVKACPPISLLYDDGSTSCLPVGLLLLAENQARIIQRHYLIANLGASGGSQTFDEIRIGNERESEQSFKARYARYCSAADGFVQNLAAGDWIGDSVFLWMCHKSYMPPLQVYFGDQEEAAAYGQSLIARGDATELAPGRRYRALDRKSVV